MFFLFVLFIGIVVWMAVSYNRLQKLSQEVKEKNSNIQVSISKKVSLINQLIDVVKSYQEGEQLVHLKISQDANSNALLSSYQQSGTVLASVKGVIEKFPDLKASGHVHKLMDDINSCELNVQRSREIFNASVKNYNSVRSAIPVVFVAQFIGFSEAPYMEFDLSGMNDVTTLKSFKTDDGERLREMFNKAGTQIAGATKTITNQAVNSAKVIGSRLNEKQANQGYFYMSPGGTPKGPIILNDLIQLLNDGKIQKDTMVSPVGSENWESIEMLTAHSDE
jgi:LemA protein